MLQENITAHKYKYESDVLFQISQLSVTKITGGHVSDEIYEEVRKQFSDEELIDLTLAVVAINSYNRFNIAFRTPAGDYQPGQFAVQAD